MRSLDSRWLRRSAVLFVLAAGVVALVAPGCSSSLPLRDPTGEAFPEVAGESLDKEPVSLPGDLRGQPTILLIGYAQNAQFDIDRWVMGLIQAGVGARLVELPTIPGLAATFASGWIDDGMRSGIPPEDWGDVVTLYGDAARPVAELTGTESGQRARVVVLDGQGMVVWFDDQGYSAKKALDLARRIEELGG